MSIKSFNDTSINEIPFNVINDTSKHLMWFNDTSINEIPFNDTSKHLMWFNDISLNRIIPRYEVALVSHSESEHKII